MLSTTAEGIGSERLWSATALLAALLAVLLGASSCDFLGPKDCAAIAIEGLWIKAYNDQTGDQVSQGLAGTATSGSYSELLIHRGANVLSGAEGRPGLYAVTVSAPGFQTWALQNVRVTKGDCYVRTVELDARLTPEGGASSLEEG